MSDMSPVAVGDGADLIARHANDIAKFNQKLVDATTTIKTLEAFLRENVAVEFHHTIKLTESDKSYEVISWEQFQKQGFRLTYLRNVWSQQSDWADWTTIEYRPLVETKSFTRVSMAAFLEDFMDCLTLKLNSAGERLPF